MGYFFIFSGFSQYFKSLEQCCVFYAALMKNTLYRVHEFIVIAFFFWVFIFVVENVFNSRAHVGKTIYTYTTRTHVYDGYLYL